MDKTKNETGGTRTSLVADAFASFASARSDSSCAFFFVRYCAMPDCFSALGAVPSPPSALLSPVSLLPSPAAPAAPPAPPPPPPVSIAARSLRWYSEISERRE